jgi:hypothetical protein
MNRFFRLSMVAAACLAAHTMATASRYGDDATRQTNPPYTSQVTNALKNLGSFYVKTTAGAWNAVGSSVLIHPEWVINAPHGNAYDPSIQSGFDLSTGLVTTPKYKFLYCYTYLVGTDRNADDVGLCRLDQAVPSTEAVPVPLVEAPEELQPDNLNASFLATNPQSLRGKLSKWGNVALLGHSNSGLPGDAWNPAIVDFGSLPYDFEAARGLTKQPTVSSSGDSGSGIFWISPTSGDVALMGVMSFASQAPRGVAYLRQATLDWVQDKLQTDASHTITRRTAEQHVGNPAGDVVAELSSPPMVKSVSNSRSTFDVSWPLAAAGTPSVVSYEVSWNQQGQTTVPKVSVSAGLGNAYQLTGLASSEYTVCARPVGSGGYAALNAFLSVGSAGATTLVYTLDRPNCKTFDTARPLPVMSALTHTVTRLSSLGIVKFAWSAGSPAPARYEVTQTISYPSGPSRVTKAETTAITQTASSTVGSTVCLSVKALNDTWMAATPQNRCVTIN